MHLSNGDGGDRTEMSEDTPLVEVTPTDSGEKVLELIEDGEISLQPDEGDKNPASSTESVALQSLFVSLVSVLCI